MSDFNGMTMVECMFCGVSKPSAMMQAMSEWSTATGGRIDYYRCGSCEPMTLERWVCPADLNPSIGEPSNN